MNIAFVSYECPPELPGGGIGSYVREASRMLADRGHRVEVFTGSLDSDGVRHAGDNLTVYRVHAPDRRKFPALVAPVFAERNRAIGFDVLEGPEFMAEAIECRAACPDVPLVIKLHTSLLFVKQIEAADLGLAGRLRRRWEAFRRGTPTEWSPRHPAAAREIAHVFDADLLASPSRSIGERVVREWGVRPDRVDYYPYPFTPSPDYLAVPPGCDDPVVTFVGRLEIRKGVINLARAVPLVRREYPAARFWFIGGSLASPRPGVPMIDYLKGILGQHAEAVEFKGRQPAEELPALLGRSAVCVFPSIWENFPFVCLEAMAAARPVVASHHCGLAEQLDGGRVGRVIDPSRPEDIAAKIVELLRDAALRRELGEMARHRVLTEYSVDAVAPRQEASYAASIRRASNRGGG